MISKLPEQLMFLVFELAIIVDVSVEIIRLRSVSKKPKYMIGFPVMGLCGPLTSHEGLLNSTPRDSSAQVSWRIALSWCAGPEWMRGDTEIWGCCYGIFRSKMRPFSSTSLISHVLGTSKNLIS